jgi:hypothetical protein
MHTIIETPIFRSDAKGIWAEGERGEFCAWLAANPEAGDVIPGSGGAARCAGRALAWASAAGYG